MTFTELTDRWKASKAMFVKQSTLAAYLLQLKNHIIPVIGHMSIEEIRSAHLQEMVGELMGKDLSVKSVKDVMIVVNMILKFGNENEFMPIVPYRVKYPSKNMDGGNKISVYTTDEQKKIVAYCIDNPSSKNFAILLTLCTGMRIGEICGLQWKNIDLENKAIYIRSTLQRVYMPNDTGKWVTKLISDQPKTSESNRDIPIPTPLLQMLKNYSKIVKDDYYLASCSKNPIEPRTLRNYYHKMILEDIRLDRCLRFHGLRHTFATKMVESGADLKTVSSIIGHSNVSITMNLYVHPTAHNKAAAMNKVFKGIF